LGHGLPLVDPTGVAFSFDATRGEFGIARSSLLWDGWAEAQRQAPGR
jgi:hypothetical protein